MIHVVSKRLIISTIVGATMSIHSFSRLVGIGSISHDFCCRGLAQSFGFIQIYFMKLMEFDSAFFQWIQYILGQQGETP